MPDVIQHLRTELNETVSGRIDMLRSINTTLQKVSAKPTVSKPYRISEGSNDTEYFRHFMSDLHLWMQAWSDEGETVLVSVESTDKFDNSTVAVDCSDEEYRSIEASIIVQQTNGQKGFGAWHAIVRRNDLRNMSDINSSYAALISNISQRDRAKDVEHFDDILGTFANEASKFEDSFGTIRDEEKMLAVKKLMLESLFKYRFRGTMSYGELLVDRRHHH